MGHRNAIYRKSAKGLEAIATRQHGLTPKQRSLLILIDGKRGFDDLAKVSQMLGDPDQLLDQLLSEGFIESSGAPEPSAPATPAADAATAPAPLERATVPLTEAKRFAVRRLTDLLGPNADDMCMRIEGTSNAHDFQLAIRHAEHVLRQFSNSRVADAFAAEMAMHTPG